MRTIALITLFRVIMKKNSVVIDESTLNKIISKNLGSIMENVQEDDDSQMRLAKEIGKVAHCLHQFYPKVFQQEANAISNFFKRIIMKGDDCPLQKNAAFNLPAIASVFEDKNLVDCSQITLQFAISLEDQTGQSEKGSSSTADTSPINASVGPI